TINGAVDKDGIGLAGKSPIKRAEPLPARVSFETDAVESLEFGALELRRLRKAAAGVSLFPNEKRLVGGIERVDLKLIIGIPPGNEDLDIVVVIDRRVVGRIFRVHQRLLDPEGDIEVLVIPENGGTRVVNRRFASQNVHEARRTGRALPCGFVEVSIDADRLADMI